MPAWHAGFRLVRYGYTCRLDAYALPPDGTPPEEAAYSYSTAFYWQRLLRRTDRTSQPSESS